MKFFQTKLQNKNINFNYYDIYYTVIKNRKEKENEEDQKEIVDNQYEIEYIKFNDFITPNLFLGLNLVKQK